MVGFDPSRVEKGLTSSQCGYCGSFAGAVTRVFAQPLDVLKIRFQLQVEPTSTNHLLMSRKGEKPTGKYTGVSQAFKLVYREEGILALWKGHVPAQILSIAYGYFQFTFFEAFTQIAYFISPRLLEQRHKPMTHFICGGISGCAASFAIQPLDVIRTRLVAQGEPKVYSSMIEAARMMYTLEGPTSFYKGLIPSLLQIFPYAGLQFGSYTLLKMIWDYTFDIRIHDPYMPADIIESLFCGAVSGMISKAVILPIDIVKKRIQIQGFAVHARAHFGKVPEYHNLRHCVRSIIKHEGVQGLYKGLVPSTIKAAVSLSITFSAYEQCLHFVRHLLHKDAAIKDLSPPASKA
ncbi:mitochondrial thiamine pyrophosphate carrier-like [Actinia tenebrosa]|uniref:Mitochondrial thiamine pyrophosphate carrier n=1 Tax=Actinia tenebrosa TaxID=6105 RepID=A0A6P8HYZ4_ACTTE|nr:mitochondrial thiamine pyrophosphate carrier-like [Actinia tenebrosa]